MGKWRCEWSGIQRFYEVVDGKVTLVEEKQKEECEPEDENIPGKSSKQPVNSPFNGLFVSTIRKKLESKYEQNKTINAEFETTNAYKFRLLCRSKDFQGPSCNSDLVGNHVQANVVLIPSEFAEDFLVFCLKNSQGCPLLEVIRPGGKSWLCQDLDIANDLPQYLIYKDGVVQGDPLLDVKEEFDPSDFVTFLLGCSFSWEGLLKERGLCPRQIEEKVNVPMYKCLRDFNTRVCIASAKEGETEDSRPGLQRVFGGNLVVSMRPYRKEDLQAVIDVTKKYPQAHGAPVHIGNPETIGIKDLNKPDFGDKVTVKPEEVPVFWACGITSQEGLMSAKLPFAITHAPGHMLVLDIINSDLEQ